MIKLLSLFSGIGAFEKALKNLNVDYEVINYCEIDKFASKAYCLIHEENENKNLWDITKVNEKKLKDFDLMTYGFPCQSFSIAGKRLGLNDSVKGNLFFESMRIAEEKKPKYLIAENVKGLLSDDNGQTMDLIIMTLDTLGYNNYFKVLNAKDYGIPQNRERIFIVSIRKDIDDLSFEFPKKINLKFTLKEFFKINEDIKMIDDECSDKFKHIITNLCPCLKANRSNYLIINLKRRLTTLECFRLTGFNESDHEKLKEISNTQKYKMAGNSIVVDVLEEILKKLFLSDNKKKWLF